jgi:hypothetical protein
MTDSETLSQLVLSIEIKNAGSICGHTPYIYTSFPVLALVIFLRDISTLVLEIVFYSLTFYYFIRFQSKKALIHHSKNNPDEKHNKEEKEESKLTSMTLYLTMTSIVIHFGVCLCYVAIGLDLSYTVVNYLIMFAGFSIVLKGALNFCIFYKCNKIFNDTFWQMFKRESPKNSSRPNA